MKLKEYVETGNICNASNEADKIFKYPRIQILCKELSLPTIV